MALLEAFNISAGYYGHPVVRDLDLRVEPGEVVGLLGPNGAGKTTTLLTLAGELRPISGKIEFHGQKTTAPLHKRAQNGMAFVTEERSVFMPLTTAENLRVGRADTAVALGLFPELEPLMDRRAGLLSGGEQQMLTLARALSRRPRVLLIDELSLGLAPQVVARLLSAVRTAADEQGVGVVLVEQHVQHALAIVDRAYVLQRGQVALQGPAEEIKDGLEAIYLAGGKLQ